MIFQTDRKQMFFAEKGLARIKCRWIDTLRRIKLIRAFVEFLSAACGISAWCEGRQVSLRLHAPLPRPNCIRATPARYGVAQPLSGSLNSVLTLFHAILPSAGAASSRRKELPHVP